MRIAIVTCGLLDSLFPLARHLSKKVEIDVYILVYGDRFTENVSSFNLKDLPLGLINQKVTEETMGRDLINYVKNDADNVNVMLFKYPNLKIFNRQNFRLHQQLAKTINRNAYDLIHFNGYRGSLMFIYKFLKSKPGKVWTIHDPILHSGEDKWQTRLGYSMFRYLKAHFIVHNKSQHPEFIKRYHIKPDHCHFVPFGPLDIFKIFKRGPKIKSNSKAILFYGRISPYKGVEYLIEAGKLAAKKVPGLKIIIAGKANYPIDLEKVRGADTFEVIDRFIENDELVDLIEKSGMIVCPYTDATQSGVIMTAYAFNKPVLATSVGGIPEVVEDGNTGRLVPPKNAKALANALIDILEDEETLQTMKKNIQEKSQSGMLSWNRIVEETVNVYDQALKG